MSSPTLDYITIKGFKSIASIENAVRSAKHLQLINSVRGKVSELECAPDIVGRDPVDQNFVEVGLAAAHEHVGSATALAGLGHFDAGHET